VRTPARSLHSKQSWLAHLRRNARTDGIIDGDRTLDRCDLFLWAALSAAGAAAAAKTAAVMPVRIGESRRVREMQTDARVKST
jgi:hypothetical protein